MSSSATLGHRLIFIVCAVAIIFLGSWLAASLFMSGLRILLFGARMMLMPILMVAIVYIVWHARKFFR